MVIMEGSANISQLELIGCLSHVLSFYTSVVFFVALLLSIGAFVTIAEVWPTVHRQFAVVPRGMASMNDTLLPEN